MATSLNNCYYEVLYNSKNIVIIISEIRPKGKQMRAYLKANCGLFLAFIENVYIAKLLTH